MGTCTYDKRGKTGNAPGYRSFPRTSAMKTKTPEFYETQNLGLGPASPENTRVGQYAKPGTSAAKRQSDAYGRRILPLPSRYRSIRP